MNTEVKYCSPVVLSDTQKYKKFRKNKCEQMTGIPTCNSTGKRIVLVALWASTPNHPTNQPSANPEDRRQVYKHLTNPANPVGEVTGTRIWWQLDGQ